MFFIIIFILLLYWGTLWHLHHSWIHPLHHSPFSPTYKCS
jgi:hypothetical protein